MQVIMQQYSFQSSLIKSKRKQKHKPKLFGDHQGSLIKVIKIKKNKTFETKIENNNKNTQTS